LMATHNLFEAERLCDRLAVMSKGRLLAFGSLDELRSQFAPGLWIGVDLLAPLPPNALQGLNLPGPLKLESPQALTLKLQVQDEADIPQVVTHLVHHGAQIVAVEHHRASLEEIYFKLQNQQKEGAQ